MTNVQEAQYTYFSLYHGFILNHDIYNIFLEYYVTMNHIYAKNVVLKNVVCASTKLSKLWVADTSIKFPAIKQT